MCIQSPPHLRMVPLAASQNTADGPAITDSDAMRGTEFLPFQRIGNHVRSCWYVSDPGLANARRCSA